MPSGFGGAYEQLTSGGWQGLSAPETYGGMGLGAITSAGVSEIFSGANHSLQMVCNLVPGAISTIQCFGSEEQCDYWIPKLASGEVLSTMCLTEPASGSDLSGITCKAAKTDADWQITGEKIFISGGDQDLSNSILHLVLARSGTRQEGMRGLSLFLCAAQPAVKVTRLEEKLGLQASPTCHMVFDGATAELIGKEGEGLRAMFTLMNHARLDVALQGTAHAARASQISQGYAEQRTQGRNDDGSPALLIDHADIRRMLNEQSTLSIGARALCHITLVELEKGDRPSLVDFLTPLCKVFCSEAGIRAADLGIQILGGYGFLNEYQIGQVWRDARITAIYEGANGIHERSIATRGLRPGGGADEFEALISELAEGNAAVIKSLKNWKSWKVEMTEAHDPLPDAHTFSQATTRLFFKASWARIGRVAHHHPSRLNLTDLAHLVLNQTHRHI
jgi:alkylation response protein AidB-like acyl-CoA dehydrogenase